MSQSVRRAAVALWLGLSAVQFVVWALICIIAGRLDAPWFLWTVVVGAGIVGGVVLLTGRSRTS